MSDSNDRRVHARNGNQEIVRYDRAGKWYHEHPNGRHKLTVHGAVELALSDISWEVVPGLPGGNRFDHLLDARLA